VLKEERDPMRDHNKAFCRLATEAFDCPGPVYEFGSYQVEGQLGYANLRSLFPGKTYVGCDFRAGPGVDRVEDVTDIKLPDGCAGTVICLETFEHVFEVRRAFDEVFRILRPGGVFIITSPLNFRIHGYPDDYWRMTPSCLRRMLTPYAGRVVGDQGHEPFPHTVMAMAMKAPLPADFAARADRLKLTYHTWLRQTEAATPFARKVRKSLAQLYRSKGERRQIADYHTARFVVDISGASLAKAS
jgi:SAM-dependent methyltransferase